MIFKSTGSHQLSQFEHFYPGMTAGYTHLKTSTVVQGNSLVSAVFANTYCKYIQESFYLRSYGQIFMMYISHLANTSRKWALHTPHTVFYFTSSCQGFSFPPSPIRGQSTPGPNMWSEGPAARLLVGMFGMLLGSDSCSFFLHQIVLCMWPCPCPC